MKKNILYFFLIETIFLVIFFTYFGGLGYVFRMVGLFINPSQKIAEVDGMYGEYIGHSGNSFYYWSPIGIRKGSINDPTAKIIFYDECSDKLKLMRSQFLLLRNEQFNNSNKEINIFPLLSRGMPMSVIFFGTQKKTEIRFYNYIFSTNENRSKKVQCL